MVHGIGFLELNSIARGIGAADEMLKAADVQLLYSRPTCPGKFTILVAGDAAALEASVAAGSAYADHAGVESLVIPRLHPQVIQAVNCATVPSSTGALGVMEFFSITSSLLAADTAAKAAEITLLDIRLGVGIGGKSYVLLTGETSAVVQAVESGTAAGRDNGSLAGSTVIPNPFPELIGNLL